jgi:hypothetical protein
MYGASRTALRMATLALARDLLFSVPDRLSLRTLLKCAEPMSRTQNSRLINAFPLPSHGQHRQRDEVVSNAWLERGRH